VFARNEARGETKKKYKKNRQNARHLSVKPEKEGSLSLSQRKAAALARSQAPIVYHGHAACRFGVDTSLSWAWRDEPHGDDVQHPAWSV